MLNQMKMNANAKPKQTKNQHKRKTNANAKPTQTQNQRKRKTNATQTQNERKRNANAGQMERTRKGNGNGYTVQQKRNGNFSMTATVYSVLCTLVYAYLLHFQHVMQLLTPTLGKEGDSFQKSSECWAVCSCYNMEICYKYWTKDHFCLVWTWRIYCWKDCQWDLQSNHHLPLEKICSYPSRSTVARKHLRIWT